MEIFLILLRNFKQIIYMNHCKIIILFIPIILTGCINNSETTSSGAEILSFTLMEYPEIIFSVDNQLKLIEADNIDDLDVESDSLLTPEFSTSDGAVVFLNETRIINRETPIDFSRGVTLTVFSEDRMTRNDYFVHLEKETPLSFLVDGISLELNPFGNAPLSAFAHIQTKKQSKIFVEILGEIPVKKSFKNVSRAHTLPILGLYAGSGNKVSISISDKDDLITLTDTITIQTAPLPPFFPDIEINTVNENLMERGFHFNEFNVGNAGNLNSYPFIYDNKGKVRWYMDLSSFGRIIWPIQFNDDGSFYSVYGVSILEFDMTGKELNRVVVEENNMHHDIIKLPNANYVVAVSRVGTTMIKNGEESISVEDFIIEVDKAGNIVTEWDMAEVLDVNRINLTDGGHDWFHMNAIWYDESDHSLIVSGRNQGLVKVNWENELQWILAPHQGWGKAGRQGQGPDTSPCLLTAVDESGNPLSDEIQQGTAESNNFSWVWGQHAPLILPNGNVFIFDNGFNRNFGNATSYSMATEYQINEDDRTVQVVWSYGKERGEETFSNIISDVDYLPETGNRLIMPGFITSPVSSSKIIELTQSGQVVFEATLLFKNQFGNLSGWGQTDITYRAGRVPLYW